MPARTNPPGKTARTSPPPETMTLKAAIIGCGRVAWMLEYDPLEKRPCTHMGAYLELEKAGKVKVVSAADTDPKRLNAFAERFGLEKDGAYNEYVMMLREARPDMVSICAYAPERFRMVMDCIDAGVRGIWCEKAFATSLQEAGEMSKACRDNGVSLIVSHMRRWYPEYRMARQLALTGGIGRLLSMVSHFSGSLIHTGTHAFDVLRWFGGPVEWVEGALEPRPGGQIWDTVEDLGGRATIQFENGVYANVHAESKGYFFFEFDIIGTHGRIRIGNNGLLEYYTPKDSRNYTGLKELYPEPFPYFDNRNPWVEALTNLIGLVEGTAQNASGPEDGYAALELAMAVHHSARNGSKRVYFPLEEKNFKVRSR